MIVVVGKSIHTLFWSTLLLGFLMLVFALIFVQIVSYHRRTEDEQLSSGAAQDNSSCTSTDDFPFKKYFGSVPAGMNSLFQCSTGGVDWGEVYDLTVSTNSYWAPVVFITF